MLTELESFITDSLTAAGFTPYRDYYNVDMLKNKNDYVAFFSVRGLKYSSKFYSCLSDEFGVEISGTIDIKAFGQMSGNTDCNAFRSKCLLFVEKLFSSESIIFSEVDLGEIETDHVLRRLTDTITISFRLLITDEVEEE